MKFRILAPLAVVALIATPAMASTTHKPKAHKTKVVKPAKAAAPAKAPKKAK